MKAEFIPIQKSEVSTLGVLRQKAWAAIYCGIYPDEMIDQFDYAWHREKDLLRLRNPLYQKTESLYLPSEHLRKIFTLSGIVKPSILLDGRIAGSWKRKGAKAEITLFESISADEKKWIAEKANLLWPELKSIVFTEN